MSSTNDYHYNVGFNQGYSGMDAYSNNTAFRRGYDAGVDERESHMLEYEDWDERHVDDYLDSFNGDDYEGYEDEAD